MSLLFAVETETMFEVSTSHSLTFQKQQNLWAVVSRGLVVFSESRFSSQVMKIGDRNLTKLGMLKKVRLHPGLS